jgi:hypothetical protein
MGIKQTGVIRCGLDSSGSGSGSLHVNEPLPSTEGRYVEQ